MMVAVWRKEGIWFYLWNFYKNEKISGLIWLLDCYCSWSGTFSGSLSLTLVSLVSVLFVIISRNSLKFSLLFPVWSNFLKADSTWNWRYVFLLWLSLKEDKHFKKLSRVVPKQAKAELYQPRFKLCPFQILFCL